MKRQKERTERGGNIHSRVRVEMLKLIWRGKTVTYQMSFTSSMMKTHTCRNSYVYTDCLSTDRLTLTHLHTHRTLVTLYQGRCALAFHINVCLMLCLFSYTHTHIAYESSHQLCKGQTVGSKCQTAHWKFQNWIAINM